MAFRRHKSNEHHRRQAWSEWVARHRETLRAVGLPPEIYLSEAHWLDFMQNGYLELHPEDRTSFEFADLSPASAGALRRFLEQEYGSAAQPPPLLGWLRVRHQGGSIE
jgi:hypothetical protein